MSHVTTLTVGGVALIITAYWIHDSILRFCSISGGRNLVLNLESMFSCLCCTSQGSGGAEVQYNFGPVCHHGNGAEHG